MKNADTIIPFPAGSPESASNLAPTREALNHKLWILESVVQAQNKLGDQIKAGTPRLSVEHLTRLAAEQIEVIKSLSNRRDDETCQLEAVTKELREFSEGAAIQPDAADSMVGKHLQAQILPGRIAKLSDEINGCIAALPIVLVPLRYEMIEVASRMHEGHKTLEFLQSTGRHVGVVRKAQPNMYSERLDSLRTQNIPMEIAALSAYGEELVRRARMMTEEYPELLEVLGGEIPEIRTRFVQMVGTCSCGCVRELPDGSFTTAESVEPAR